MCHGMLPSTFPVMNMYALPVNRLHPAYRAPRASMFSSVLVTLVRPTCDHALHSAPGRDPFHTPSFTNRTRFPKQ